MDSDKSVRHHNYEWLKPYHWQPGQSGNPSGRPAGKGKSLKQYAREYIASLDETQKQEWLRQISKKEVWKMAEGDSKKEAEVKADTQVVIKVIAFNGDNATSQV